MATITTATESTTTTTVRDRTTATESTTTATESTDSNDFSTARPGIRGGQKNNTMPSILEVFDQDEIDLIMEALDHRQRYYKNKIPQQRTNAACGTVRASLTLERYEEMVQRLQEVIDKWVLETT
jgi:hypothetical protein